MNRDSPSLVVMCRSPLVVKPPYRPPRRNQLVILVLISAHTDDHLS